MACLELDLIDFQLLYHVQKHQILIADFSNRPTRQIDRNTHFKEQFCWPIGWCTHQKRPHRRRAIDTCPIFNNIIRIRSFIMCLHRQVPISAYWDYAISCLLVRLKCINLSTQLFATQCDFDKRQEPAPTRQGTASSHALHRYQINLTCDVSNGLMRNCLRYS